MTPSPDPTPPESYTDWLLRVGPIARRLNEEAANDPDPEGDEM